MMLSALNGENTGQYRDDPPFSYRRGIMAVHRSPKANYAGSIPAAYAI